MSTKAAGASVSAKIKNERVTITIRHGVGTKGFPLSFWASDYPYEEHMIDKKNWMGKQMLISEGCAPDLCKINCDGWRIVEACVKESDFVYVASMMEPTQ